MGTRTSASGSPSAPGAAEGFGSGGGASPGPRGPWPHGLCPRPPSPSPRHPRPVPPRPPRLRPTPALGHAISNPLRYLARERGPGSARRAEKGTFRGVRRAGAAPAAVRVWPPPEAAPTQQVAAPPPDSPGLRPESGTRALTLPSRGRPGPAPGALPASSSQLRARRLRSAPLGSAGADAAQLPSPAAARTSPAARRSQRRLRSRPGGAGPRPRGWGCRRRPGPWPPRGRREAGGGRAIGVRARLPSAPSRARAAPDPPRLVRAAALSGLREGRGAPETLSGRQVSPGQAQGTGARREEGPGTPGHLRMRPRSRWPAAGVGAGGRK